MHAIFRTQFGAHTTPMSALNHPYRIIVTNGGARRVVITLARVMPNTSPARVKSPAVEKVLGQWVVHLPKNTPTGVCMPPRPPETPETLYDRELGKAYALYDQLVQAEN